MGVPTLALRAFEPFPKDCPFERPASNEAKIIVQLSSFHFTYRLWSKSATTIKSWITNQCIKSWLDPAEVPALFVFIFNFHKPPIFFLPFDSRCPLNCFLQELLLILRWRRLNQVFFCACYGFANNSLLETLGIKERKKYCKISFWGRWKCCWIDEK